MRINLVFHDIIRSGDDFKNEFSVTLDYYLFLVAKIEDAIAKKQAAFDEVCFYFDDGHKSFKDLVFPLIVNDFKKYCLAIVTDRIGQEGYLNMADLSLFRDKGISIASHGYSHAALAIYNGDKLQDTPPGGLYKNSDRGKEKILTENQVVYQLIESKKALADILKWKIDEFVFPYGLYNNETLKINRKSKTYSYLATCDEYLDYGKYLRPRFLITNKRSGEQTMALISRLRPQK